MATPKKIEEKVQWIYFTEGLTEEDIRKALEEVAEVARGEALDQVKPVLENAIEEWASYYDSLHGEMCGKCDESCKRREDDIEIARNFLKPL